MLSCENCRYDSMPHDLHFEMVNRQSDMINKLFIICLVLAIALIVSNLIWLICLCDCQNTEPDIITSAALFVERRYSI